MVTHAEESVQEKKASGIVKAITKPPESRSKVWSGLIHSNKGTDVDICS